MNRWLTLWSPKLIVLFVSPTYSINTNSRKIRNLVLESHRWSTQFVFHSLVNMCKYQTASRVRNCQSIGNNYLYFCKKPISARSYLIIKIDNSHSFDILFGKLSLLFLAFPMVRFGQDPINGGVVNGYIK